MEVISIFLLAIGIGFGLVAFFSVLNVFFINRISKTRYILENLPGRAFLIGLVNGIFLTALLLVFVRLGETVAGWAHGLAIIVMIPLGVGLTFGWGGVVQYIGENLVPQQNAFVRTAWGAVGLGLASALPFFGWFLLFPFVSLIGLGAFITSFFYREREAQTLEDSEG